MSKTILKKEIQKEIKVLNGVIDMRIIKGLPYKTLAKRHTFLVKELRSIRSASFFRMLGQYASAFLM